MSQYHYKTRFVYVKIRLTGISVSLNHYTIFLDKAIKMSSNGRKNVLVIHNTKHALSWFTGVQSTINLSGKEHVSLCKISFSIFNSNSFGTSGWYPIPVDTRPRRAEQVFLLMARSSVVSDPFSSFPAAIIMYATKNVATDTAQIIYIVKI